MVAVGTQLNELELRGIASSPEQQNVYTVRSYRQLTSILPSMVSAMCNGQYVWGAVIKLESVKKMLYPLYIYTGIYV